MAKLVLIGCSPSSGSTMFADLLDSSEFSACGPELEFFCNRNLYDFEKFKKAPSRQSELFSIGSTGIFPRYERLKHYGLDEAQLSSMISDSKSFLAFQSSFASHFSNFRSKSQDSLIFEKTPQNANAIDLWLNASEENHFVFLIRDPFYVLNSLMNRGWSLYMSLVTWLSYFGKVSSHLEHSRFHLVKLEDLVENPFITTAQLINDIHGSLELSADQIESGYENNSYRKQSSSRKAEWEIQGVAQGIQNPNAKPISKQRLQSFSEIADQRLSKQYAKCFELANVSVKEASERLGYDTSRFENVASRRLMPSSSERRKFLVKSLRSALNGSGNLMDWRVYANALTNQ